jgi:hypothetical protein
MRGSETPSVAGRFTALAALAASVVLFATALIGIASIDPSANAASPAGGPSIHNVSIDQKQGPKPERRDCPFKKRDRAPQNGDGAGTSGVSS